MAIMARWRMPPLNWWGYSLSRCLGAAMRTRSSISSARARASVSPTFWCSLTVSAIWLPMVRSGLSEVMGSWKIMAISPPRMARICDPRGSSLAMSIAGLSSLRCSRISPWVILPGGSLMRRMTDMAVTLLPQPLSPTTPNVDCRPRVNVTPRTALRTRFSTKK